MAADWTLIELLCPLRHPSELAAHPTLSPPFLDSALPDMIKSTEETLRQERANLWRAKNLSRQFMGDEAWVPCGVTQGADDWDLFDPKPKVPIHTTSRKRKRNPENGVSQNGINGHDPIESDKNHEVAHSKSNDPQTHSKNLNKDATKNPTEPVLTDSIPEQSIEEKSAPDRDEPMTNGVHTESAAPYPEDNSQNPPTDPENSKETEDESSKTEAELNEQEQEQPENPSEDETLPVPTRRITRALAAEHNDSTAATPPLSPKSTTSSVDSDLLQTDPIFLLPPLLAANHRTPRSLLRFGIPVDELLETRRLLIMFIQKQEETVRGYEAVVAKLIKAKRMRDKVWQWCKVEGHVGELSDGEDWIDAEMWGLKPEDLKKGTDEDNNEAQEDTGRKAKRRRRD